MLNWILIERICKFLVWVFLPILLAQLFFPPITLPIFGRVDTLIIKTLYLIGIVGLFARFKNTGKLFQDAKRSLMMIALWLIIFLLYLVVRKAGSFDVVYRLLNE